MNSEKSRTSEYHVLVLKLADKLDLRRGQKSVSLILVFTSIYLLFTLLSIYLVFTTKSSYNNSKFKVYAPTSSDKFKLPDGSYSTSNIQN